MSNKLRTGQNFILHMAIDFSRITLRLFKPNDVDDFMLWAADDKVTENIRMQICASKEDALQEMFGFLKEGMLHISKETLWICLFLASCQPIILLLSDF